MDAAHDTVAKLRARLASEFRARYDQSEQMVREQLVVPLLRAIGWDPEDPAQLQARLASGEDGSGYTLFHAGHSALFVEVVRGSTDLEDPRVLQQALRQAAREGNRSVALTNGSGWMLVRAAGGDLEPERVLWRADVEADPPAAFLRKLRSLAPESIGLHEGLFRRCQVLDEAWDAVVTEREALVAAMVPVIAASARLAHPDVGFEPDEVGEYVADKLSEALGDAYLEAEEPAAAAPRPAPAPTAVPAAAVDGASGPVRQLEGARRIRLGAQELAVATPLEMLVTTAEWLIGEGRLGPGAAPVHAGPNRYLINREPRHRDRAMVAPHRLSNGLFMETHHSPANCIANARKLLSYLYPEATLEVL
jgi:hypothetical protein